jgi:hypothetical protein
MPYPARQDVFCLAESARLSVRPPVRLSVRPSVCLPVRPSARPSARPSVRLSVGASVPPSAHSAHELLTCCEQNVNRSAVY